MTMSDSELFFRLANDKTLCGIRMIIFAPILVPAEKALYLSLSLPLSLSLSLSLYPSLSLYHVSVTLSSLCVAVVSCQEL